MAELEEKQWDLHETSNPFKRKLSITDYLKKQSDDNFKKIKTGMANRGHELSKTNDLEFEVGYHALLKYIKSHMEKATFCDHYYFNGDIALVDQLLLKLYEEIDMQEIWIVFEFIQKYKNKCLYGILNRTITKISSLCIRKLYLCSTFCNKLTSKLPKESLFANLVYNALFPNINLEFLSKLLESIHPSYQDEDKIQPNLFILEDIYPLLKIYSPNIEEYLRKNVNKINKLFEEKDVTTDFKDTILWLERTGIYISKSLMILTPEMAEIFGSVLHENTSGWTIIYAKKIFNELILCLLNCTQMSFNIDKSALLGMFQDFKNYFSVNHSQILLPYNTEILSPNSKECEYILECEKHVSQM